MAVGACHERDLAPDPTAKDAQIRIRSGGHTRHVCEVSCLGVGSGPSQRRQPPFLAIVLTVSLSLPLSLRLGLGSLSLLGAPLSEVLIGSHLETWSMTRSTIRACFHITGSYQYH